MRNRTPHPGAASLQRRIGREVEIKSTGHGIYAIPRVAKIDLAPPGDQLFRPPIHPFVLKIRSPPGEGGCRAGPLSARDDAPVPHTENLTKKFKAILSWLNILKNTCAGRWIATTIPEIAVPGHQLD